MPLAKAQRLHSRKQRGACHRRKSAARLARIHRRIRYQRTDFLHKATTMLAKTRSVIVVEDLSVRGMVRNHHLARSIADAGWGEFRRMLEYKTTWYRSPLVVAPRFDPSTKTCSACGSRRMDAAIQADSGAWIVAGRAMPTSWRP